MPSRITQMVREGILHNGHGIIFSQSENSCHSLNRSSINPAMEVSSRRSTMEASIWQGVWSSPFNRCFNCSMAGECNNLADDLPQTFLYVKRNI